MKYCSNCGAEVEEDDIYCGYCGSKLKEDSSKEEDYTRQDFKEDSFEGADFSSKFDNDFEQNYDDGFDESFTEGNSFSKADGVEEEPYVESDDYTQSTFDSNDDTTSSKHKTLLPNKLAKDAHTYGILALLLGFVGGILGIVFGAIGLDKAKKAMRLCDTGEYDGKSKVKDAKILSIAGIVVGIFSLISYIL